jgi:NAD(P)H-dependent flavin oxidoreductase YrpB (nitropropane dioxygenase family)
MVLWPQIVDAVSPLTVLAAGGIGRGRQMAAAMVLGADGVWCGSIWLGTKESELTPEMKERFFAASSEDAIQRRVFTGKQCRTLRSAFTDAWDAPGAPSPLSMPQQGMLVAEARARIERARKKECMGLLRRTDRRRYEGRNVRALRRLRYAAGIFRSGRTAGGPHTDRRVSPRPVEGKPNNFAGFVTKACTSPRLDRYSESARSSSSLSSLSSSLSSAIGCG